jgi:hypothetical protein
VKVVGMMRHALTFACRKNLQNMWTM